MNESYGMRSVGKLIANYFELMNKRSLTKYDAVYKTHLQNFEQPIERALKDVSI